MTEEIERGFQKQVEVLKERKMSADKREQKLADEEELNNQLKHNLDLKNKKLEEERTKFEEEKGNMSQVGPVIDDIIEVNVQGTIFCTSRLTLTQVPGARLTNFFNGRRDSKLNRDSQNRAFFDIIPSEFRKLLDYLTARRFLKKNEEVPAPALEGTYSAYFQNLVRYFGLENELYGGPMNFSRQLKSPSIILNEEASSAKLAVDGTAFVLGERIYENDFVEFTLIINSIDENFPKMFIGVMINTSDPIEDNSFNGNILSYGFSDYGHKWFAGKKIEENGNQTHVFYSGMEIKLVLCCKNDENYLSMKVDESEEEIYINDLPDGQKWRLHVNMVGKGDEISLINIQDAEEYKI